MKKFVPILLVIVLMLCLFGGCVTANTVHDPVETTAGGQKVVVQYDDGSINSGTVTDANGDVYRFSGYFSKERASVDIIYPDGAKHYASRSGNSGSSSYFPLFDDPYIDTLDLLDAIVEAKPRTLADLNWPLIGVALVVGIISIISVSSPEGMWHFELGWMFKNAEPSNLSLSLYRVFGYIGIFAAAIMLLVGIFS